MYRPKSIQFLVTLFQENTYGSRFTITITTIIKNKVNNMATQAQIRALNAARERAVASGQSAYSGNLASLASFAGSQNPRPDILKPGGFQTLQNYTPPNISPPRAGEVPQVYTGSTTTSQGGVRDYTAPSSQFTPGPTYIAQPTPPNKLPPVSSSTNDAFAALKAAYNSAVGGAKGLVGKVSNALSSSATNQPASVLTGFQNVQQATSSTPTTPPATTTPTVTPGAESIITSQPVTETGTGKISDQYTLIAQDKSSDSTTLKSKIDSVKQQEDQQKQAQIQNIQAQLQQKLAELAALQSQQTPQTETTEAGFNPEAQANIGNISSQVSTKEREIAELQRSLSETQEDSPEYKAATESLNAKIAEEAMIKARLTKGIANIEEQPIAYSFLQGQSAALRNQANADLQTNYAARIPLTQQLATAAKQRSTEQAKKQASIDVAKSEREYLGGERKRATDIYKTNYERQNKLVDTATEQANKLALQVAKPPSGTSSSSITQLKNALNASKFQGPEADGKYADPNLYLQNYQSWIQSGGSAEEFFRNFPPSTYINPANTWLPAEIMQFVKKEESGLSNPFQ